MRSEWPNADGLPARCLSIGGFARSRQAVEPAGVDILVARVRPACLVLERTPTFVPRFEAYGIDEFDLHTIETKRLRYDSGERGLLRDAMARAIPAHRGLTFMSGDGVSTCSTRPMLPDTVWDAAGRPCRRADGSSGRPSRTSAGTRGLATRLDWADDVFGF